MKAGGDKDGIWALFESGIQCVSALSPLFVSDTFPQCLRHHGTYPIRPAHFTHSHRKEGSAYAFPGVWQRTGFAAIGSWRKQKRFVLPPGTPIQ
jgi:hypothetical protein